MTSFQKVIEIDLMEFTKDMSLMEDADYIAFIEGDYYEESGDTKKQNIFEKAIKYVRDLIRKIKDKLSEKFSEANVKKQQEKLKMEILSDPNKKNKKVKVRINDKVYALDKKALGDLTKCKTKDQVEKYMKDYKKKREKLVAGSIVAVSAATAIGILGSKLHKTHKQLDELQKGYEKSIKTLKDRVIWQQNMVDDAYYVMTDQDKRIHDLTDRNKALIKIARNDREKTKERANAILQYADNVRLKHVDPRGEYKNRVYNRNIGMHMYNGDMDRAKAHTDVELRTDILSGMNQIIRVATALGGDYTTSHIYP